MNPVARNILAAIVGFAVGCAVNITIVNVGPSIIPLPEGADVSDMDKLKESMKLFKPVNFVPPFLAHALGTLAGAFVAAKVAASHRMKFAIGVGVCFLIGGIMAVRMLGGPMWFQILDLVVAYLPMGLLGGVLAGAHKPAAASSAAASP